MATFQEWWDENYGEFSGQSVQSKIKMRMAYDVGVEHQLTKVDEQQKRIDELQKQLIDQGQRFNENTQKIADAEYKNRQLQSRMDAANAVIHEYYTGSYQESPDLVVDLEQALKGGEV